MHLHKIDTGAGCWQVQDVHITIYDIAQLFSQDGQTMQGFMLQHAGVEPAVLVTPTKQQQQLHCRLCAMIHLLQHVWEPNVKFCRRDEDEQKQYMHYASSTVRTAVATWAVLDHCMQCVASLCCHPQTNATLYLPPFRVTIMSSSMKGSSWRATQKACCTSLA